MFDSSVTKTNSHEEGCSVVGSEPGGKGGCCSGSALASQDTVLPVPNRVGRVAVVSQSLLTRPVEVG